MRPEEKTTIKWLEFAGPLGSFISTQARLICDVVDEPMHRGTRVEDSSPGYWEAQIVEVDLFRTYVTGPFGWDWTGLLQSKTFARRVQQLAEVEAAKIKLDWRDFE